MKEKEPQVLKDFAKYLAVQNYSTGTIEGYVLDLMLFFNFIIKYLKLNINVSNISIFILINVERKDIFAFLTYLCCIRENSVNTRKRKIVSIRQFYNWLYEKYNTYKGKEKPTDNLPPIQSTERLPKHLKLEEARKLKNIFNHSNSRHYIRNNAIISLFLATAIRLSELINIKLKNIDFDNKSIVINGKGNKERVVYLTDALIDVLKNYLQTRKVVNYDDYLFVTDKNTKLSRRSIENICQHAFELAGITGYGYTPHTLRHTTATYIYKSTKDILAVKELLGHTSLAATMIYTHVENEDLRKAINSNPLNQFEIRKVGERKCII